MAEADEGLAIPKTGELDRPMSDRDPTFPVYRGVAVKDGVEYEVIVSLDIPAIEGAVAEAIEDWGDTVGNPTYDNTFRPGGGLVFRLGRRLESP